MMRAICALVTRVGAISLPLPMMTARVMATSAVRGYAFAALGALAR